MSRVTYQPLAPRDPRAASLVNAIYNAIEGADAVNAENFREEGLDQRAFVSDVQGEVVAEVVNDVRPGVTLGVTAGWTNYTHIGATGAVTMLAGDLLLIRALVVFQNTYNAGIGLTLGQPFQLRIVYDNGAVQAITHSQKTIQNLAGAVYGRHPRCETVGILAGATTVNLIRLQYQLTAGVAFPNVSRLWATRFRRIS